MLVHLSRLYVRCVMDSPTHEQCQGLVVKWNTEDVVKYLQDNGLDNEVAMAFHGKQLFMIAF